nr:MAG TPA: hypothetical protein [Caudoviricetes sp.]
MRIVTIRKFIATFSLPLSHFSVTEALRFQIIFVTLRQNSKH